MNFEAGWYKAILQDKFEAMLMKNRLKECRIKLTKDTKARLNFEAMLMKRSLVREGRI